MIGKLAMPDDIFMPIAQLREDTDPYLAFG
jgi:hypothetical protein